MSQNSLALPLTGTLSGLALVESVNGALDTLNTLASAASAPSSPEAGQLWHDTGNKVLRIRSEDNTSWITIGTLDENNYLFSATAAASAVNLSGTLGLANGGTGTTTAEAALAALLGGESGGVLSQAPGGTGTSALSNLFAQYPSVNGYVKLPSGIMFQWEATGVIGATSSTYVYFPTTFPTAAFVVSGSLITASGISNAAPTFFSLAANAVGITNQSSAAAQVYLFAMGY